MDTLEKVKDCIGPLESCNGSLTSDNQEMAETFFKVLLLMKIWNIFLTFLNKHQNTCQRFLLLNSVYRLIGKA